MANRPFVSSLLTGRPGSISATHGLNTAINNEADVPFGSGNQLIVCEKKNGCFFVNADRCEVPKEPHERAAKYVLDMMERKGKPIDNPEFYAGGAFIDGSIEFRSGVFNTSKPIGNPDMKFFHEGNEEDRTIKGRVIECSLRAEMMDQWKGWAMPCICDGRCGSVSLGTMGTVASAGKELTEWNKTRTDTSS